MPVSVSIEPLTSSIDMYDSPDTSSAYSLSGHITIAASTSSSILGLSRSSPHNLLLSSLELTFEGQSELVLTDVGYAPLRLISITKQLVSPSHPVQITTDEDHAEWRVVFNLAVPGWLPATAVFGDHDDAGVSYALYARARFHSAGADIDDAAAAAPTSSTSSMWNNLCSVVRLGAGRPRVVQAGKVPIRVTRYVSPPTRAYSAEDALPPPFPRCTFAVRALSECSPGDDQSTNIPADCLRSVQLHAVVPSRTSVEDANVPLLLRLRSRSDDEEARSRLRVMGFEANVVQVERYHTYPSASFTSRFPIPPSAQQPPNMPLKSPHPIGTLFELGLIGLPPLGNQAHVHERSIIPDGASKHFKIRCGEEESTNGGVAIDDSWVRMEVDVPISPGLQTGDEEKTTGKRVTSEGPFFDVKHEMRIRLTVGYEQPADAKGEVAMLLDELAFTIPLEFVRITPAAVSPLASPFFPVLAHMHSCSMSSLPLAHPPMTPRHTPSPSRSRTRSLSSLSTDASRPASPFPPPLPHAPCLPAYSQLFHENGDRKEDIHIALPLYREREEKQPEPEPRHAREMPRRALSASSTSSGSTSSREDSVENSAALGMFSGIGISVPMLPRTERSSSSDSPTCRSPARRALSAPRSSSRSTSMSSSEEDSAALGMFSSMGISVSMAPRTEPHNSEPHNSPVSLPRHTASGSRTPSESRSSFEDGLEDSAALGMFSSMSTSVPIPPRTERHSSPVSLPRRAASGSRAPSESASSFEDGLEDSTALGVFSTMGVSVPMPPRLERSSSLDSPVSPGMPLTPPGLGACPAPQGKRPGKARGKKPGKPKGKKRKNMFGESFLRLDEDEDERDHVHVHVQAAVAHQRSCGNDDDLDSVRGDVHYGIAL